jgi:uncharacterized protein YecE (DUF72 family)
VPGLYVGTSGFSYPSWRGTKEDDLGATLEAAFGRSAFYPAGTKANEFLRVYAERLSSVELNATFYRLPSEDQLRSWAGQTPAGFRFAVKMSRQITHFGRVDGVGTFCERVHALGDRLGPILVQLPPTRPRDDGLLRLFLDSLDPSLRYAFEFRHASWDGVDLEGRALVGSLEGDAPFRYLRLREPPYDEAALRALAGRLRPVLAAGIDVFAYFKHEDEPIAPMYAQRLRALCETP